jgi:DNA primase
MSYLDFRAIKARVTIRQVLDHYGLTAQLKRAGESLTGRCPIHQGDRSDSFRVSPDKNCYHCFSCQAHGNQLDLVAALENCSAKEAAQKLTEWFRLDGSQVNSEGAKARRPEPKREPPKVASTTPAKPAQPTAPVKTERALAEPNKPLGFSLADKLDYTHPYLAERGLGEAAIREFGVGFCNAGTLIGRIAIPLENWKGELVGYVGRWPGEPPTPETPKYKLPKGFRKNAELFNFHRVLRERPEDPLYLVEGVVDVLHLWQLGLKKVVALLGSSLSAEQEALLFERTPFAPQLVLLLDADDAGRKGTADMLVRLAPRTFVKVVTLPREGMQPEHLTPAEITSLPYLGDRP